MFDVCKYIDESSFVVECHRTDWLKYKNSNDEDIYLKNLLNISMAFFFRNIIK